MKSIFVALAAVALVAGCAELSEDFKHPFVASAGATTQTDTQDTGSAKQPSPYPYNSPYGN